MRANAAQAIVAAATASTAALRRPRRYLLKIRTSDKPWAAAGTAAMGKVFGTDQLGRDATALFQSALQEDTYENYGSNLCHRRTPHGHPLSGRLVDKLYGPRLQVHRLHDAALPGSPDVLRIPHQGPLTLGWCGTNRDAFGGTLGHRV